jgi:hypothetical protein
VTPGADGLHLADDVAAEAVGVGELEAREPAADPEVEVVEGDGPDADAHLAGRGVGDVDLGGFEDAGGVEVAVGVEDDGAAEGHWGARMITSAPRPCPVGV